jgi:hypothetical protein
VKKPQLLAAALVLVIAGAGAAGSRAPGGAERPAMPGLVAALSSTAGF